MFWQNRQARLLSAQNHLPAFEWGVLLLGALIVIIFTFLFGIEHFHMQLLMTGLFGTLLSLNFALLLFFAYPFNSELGIQANALGQSKTFLRKRISSRIRNGGLVAYGNVNQWGIGLFCGLENGCPKTASGA